jgi:NADH-quinone oxidoreductase subunit J
MLAIAPVDGILFFGFALMAVVSALLLILQRNPVHSAMLLVATLFAVAAMFVLQQAHFLAAVQVIVYAGAIVVLFLFVIMLLGVDRREDLHETLPFQRPIGIALGLLLWVMVLALGKARWATGPPNADPATQLNAGSGTVEVLGRNLFARFLYPFEITSLLLVVAAVGAVVLARRQSEEQSEDPVEQDRAEAAP